MLPASKTASSYLAFQLSITTQKVHRHNQKFFEKTWGEFTLFGINLSIWNVQSWLNHALVTFILKNLDFQEMSQTFNCMHFLTFTITEF